MTYGRRAAHAALVALLLAGLPTFGEARISDDDAGAPPAPPAAPAPHQNGAGNIAERISAQSRKIPDREDRVVINLGSPYFNAIFGGMGEGSGIAGGIQFTTADAIHGVRFLGTALFSTKAYRLFEGEMVVPSIGSENTRGNVFFRYKRRTKDSFFGLGPTVGPLEVSQSSGPSSSFVPGLSGEDLETNYDLEQRELAGSVSHRFALGIEAGVFANYVSSSTYPGDDDNDPPIDFLFTNPGGPPPTTSLDGLPRAVVPGLYTGSKILSEGAYLEVDRRIEDGGLTRGFYGYARITSNDAVGGIDVPGGSVAVAVPGGPDYLTSNLNDFGWYGATFDVRGYVPIGSPRTSLALRYYSELNEPKGGSDIPFYDQARLGGRSSLRAFDPFRFHGENSILFQAELRQTVWQDGGGNGIDVFAFGDSGQVWGVASNRRTAELAFDELTADNFEVDYGGGAQLRIAKSFAVRVEVAHGNEATKVLFSFSKGF